MDITINNFKSHINYNLRLDKGTLNLLNGDSGCGKTTIFQAISWVLYGLQKKVSPYNPQGKLSVELETEFYKITRQKDPGLLYLFDKISCCQLEGKLAQEEINKIFSIKNIWSISSYIQQGKRCELLDLSQSDKMDFLNEFSFNNDNPRYYIDIFNTNINTLSGELKNSLEIYKYITDEINKKLKDNNFTEIIFSDENITKNIKDNLEMKKKEYDILRDKKIRNDHNKDKKDSLNIEIDSKKKELYSISEAISKIDFLSINIELKKEEEKEKDIYLLRTYIDKFSKTEKEINKIKSKFRNGYYEELIQYFKINNIYDVNKNIIDYNINTSVCSKYSIEYSKIIVDEMIKNLNIKIEERKLFDKYYKIYNIIKEKKKEREDIIAILKNKFLLDVPDNYENIKEVNKDDIKNMENDIETKKMSLNILNCPNCNCGLRLIDNLLVVEKGSKSCEKEINTLRNNLSKLKEYKDYIEKYNVKIKELNELFKLIDGNIFVIEKLIEEKKFNNSMSLEKLYEIVRELENIKYIDKPLYNITDINNFKELNEIEKSSQVFYNDSIVIDELIEKFRLTYDDFKIDFKSEIDKINSYYYSCLGKINEFKKIKNHLIELETKYKYLIDNIEQLEYKVSILIVDIDIDKDIFIEDNIKVLYNELLKLEKDYYNSIIFNDINIKNKQSEELNRKIKNLELELNYSNTILKDLIELENLKIEDIVSTINIMLDDILKVFFENNITVTLELYKTTKTTNNIKSSVNLKINYMNASYDSIYELSGGEGDRISLALSLVLSKISNSKIILLDECISSLDNDNKEKCLSYIKSFMGNEVIILVVCHDIPQEFFDNTYTL